MVSYTEHTLKLPDGVEIYYTDSGAPNSADYTTLVLLHGSANADGCLRLHERAHANNLRIVLYHRRDYRGSTKYTDAELEDLKAGRKIFQERHALQLAWFFEHFIKNEKIPALSPDRRTGGIIIVGWSFGNATGLSILADPSVLPQSLYDTVRPYLKTYVLHNPPYTALGYVLPGEEYFYNPWGDPEYATPDEKHENFNSWVTSYFTHPDIESGRPSGISCAKRTERQTYATWTDEQKATYFDKEAAGRSELPMYAPPMQAMLNAQTHQALFNVHLVSSFFPEVNVLYLSGSATCYYCIWAYMESLRMYKEAVAREEKVRPTTFKLVDGGNHFMPYDMPDVLLREIVQGCE